MDIFLDDPHWADWAESALANYSDDARLFINSIVYAEVSIGFKRIEACESGLNRGGFQMLEIPKEALFLAGKVFLNYRKSSGKKRFPLPDFYIGAHAAIPGIPLITRDVSRYRTYFPSVRLISPER